MPDYCIYTLGKKSVALRKSEVKRACELLAQGYCKEFEEVHAASESQATERFADITKNNNIDRHNFLAGAGAMPLIGILIAVVTFIFWRKK